MYVVSPLSALLNNQSLSPGNSATHSGQNFPSPLRLWSWQPWLYLTLRHTGAQDVLVSHGGCPSAQFLRVLHLAHVTGFIFLVGPQVYPHLPKKSPALHSVDSIGLSSSHGMHLPWFPVLCAHLDSAYALTKGWLSHATKVEEVGPGHCGLIKGSEKEVGMPSHSVDLAWLPCPLLPYPTSWVGSWSWF